MQHDEDEDCDDEGLEEAREAREEGLTAGGMEELLAGLGSNEDANLLDIGNGTDGSAATAATAGQPPPPATLDDLLGNIGAAGRNQPSAKEADSEAGATADLLGL